MKVLQLLVVSSDTTNRNALKDALGQDRFNVTNVDSEEAAVEQFCRQAFDVVVIGKELTDEAVRKLNAVVRNISGETVVIRQKDDNYQNLKEGINKVYTEKKKENLQHITVNDTTDAKNMEGLIRIIE